MKKIIGLLLFTLSTFTGFAQVKIHSHNDYEQKNRFHLAYNNRVYQIEADVFEVAGELIVAHNKKGINPVNTLDRLYLKPIDSLFKLYEGRVSDTKRYTFTLMIDFKTDWETTYQALKKQIEKYGDIFDRSKNKNAVQIVISGNRPPDSTFHTYPTWIFFDGLPTVNYAASDLKRITMISDNFGSYSRYGGNGEILEADKIKLKKVIEDARKIHRPVRFWGAPDTPDCWQELYKLGTEIINTDKISECKTYLEKHK
jgi:hypothetical protein